MYYGFDVGGTKIEFGAFDQSLKRVATERVPTPGHDYDLLIDQLAQLVLKYDEQFDAKGMVGIGIPGVEDVNTQTVLTVNVPCANQRTLRLDLEARIDRRVALENDANCFALSEAWDDELKDMPSVMGLILGTGFGGGLIFSGKVFSGFNHVAGELGHTRLPVDAWLLLREHAPLLDCGCGKTGCLDSYLSGRGFELLYAHFAGTEREAIDIVDDYYKGEQFALSFVDIFIEMVAMCFANLFTAHDPHIVALGGGLSNFSLLYEELPKRIPKYLLPVAKCPRIIKAKHGDSGGVRGAAFLNII
ncbi:N-acetylglucosamine kinase [Vibrio hippocampi]|uniref:N-acetylglucosamine kinase n=1 Tax=Vibrio hippocampi TaxID=654686 RepID=A0ABM8ZKQ2_9VIBR|nr:N-acetylglucosamine kinase [Vibrio hippocampi]CAH0528841.1 N-acetyl-D-glucosamine kinase [Vibrio hippocampi]